MIQQKNELLNGNLTIFKKTLTHDGERCDVHHINTDNFDKISEYFDRNSNLDFWLVIKEITDCTPSEIKDIFGFASKIDLSIHSTDEVIKTKE